MTRAARAPEPPADRARRPGRRLAARRPPTGARSSPSTSATSTTRDVMAEAALIAALEDRPVIFEGLEDIEPADRARLLRAIEQRPERTVVAAPTRTAALALGERTVLLVEAASPTLRRAPARPGPTSPARRDRRRRREVPALDDARSSRPPRSRGWPPTARGADVADAGRPGPRRAPGVLLAARRARRPAPARLPLGGPRRPRAPARAAALDQRLPAPPRPRALRLGLREDRRAHAGPEGPVRGRVRHRQDDGRAGARRRARPGDLPRRPRDDGVASTSARPRRTSTASSAPPRAPTRSSSSTRPTRCSASARRSATRTTATRTSRSPTCCRRWRATRARSSSRRTSAATSTTRSCAGSTS